MPWQFYVSSHFLSAYQPVQVVVDAQPPENSTKHRDLKRGLLHRSELPFFCNPCGIIAN